jgi:putative transposase
MNEPHRKTIKRYHDPGDIHELTFSVYKRQQLLTNNAWRAKLSECITAACEEVGCFLAAFVYMPEHVHLLVWGIQAKEDVSTLLGKVKQPLSHHVKGDLVAANSRLLHKLTILERPGKTVFRFWQEGPGYDRNLQTKHAVATSIDYIHQNPVRRKLCQKARDWRWSSARYYESDGGELDPLHPVITFLPYEFWL